MRCLRCLVEPCLCGELVALATRTRVVIVRHHLEQHRSSNTGRLAHLGLANSAIVDHGGGTLTELGDLTGAHLVFPEGAVSAAPQPPPATLVVLDATWSQARRMYRKLAALRGLPLLRLPDEPMPAARLRESPAPGRVSTIEAIARALRLVESDAAACHLENIFRLAVERAAGRGRIVGA